MDLERLNRGVAGRYRLERELGSGGMATVYLAEDLRHRRRVAVKVLRPELAAALGPDRFLREIEVIAGLNHPHILPLHDSGEVEGAPYYVMPAVEGESLRDRLEREGPLPIDESLRIAKDLAGALDYAHRQGVVHRDIKPENVLLHEGEALLADFGIALAVSQAGGERLTETGFTPGTPQYMSPEQASGDVTPDARTDVYALGAVLYEMLSGEPPYTGLTAQAVLVKVLADPVPSVRRLRATVPETVDEVVTRALAKAPVDRYETAGHLHEALNASTASDADRRARMAPLLRTRRRVVLGAGAAAVVVAAAAVVLWSAPDVAPPAADDTHRLAILPWEVSGDDPELAYLGEGLVHLLSSSLDGVGETRVVDPHTLLGFVDRECDTVDPECGRRLATRFGAGAYVLGTVLPLGPERFELIATLYRNDGASVQSVRAQAARASPETAIDALGRGLVAAEEEDRRDLAGIAALTSTSLPALKAYLEGERAFRGLDIVTALDAFGRALEADTTFALADFRLAEAAGWAARFDLLYVHAQRAMRHRERLPVRARRLLEAFWLFWSGDGAAAEAAFRSIVRTYPDDATAWYWLAESVLHHNALRGEPATEAGEPFERALLYDPGHVGALFHLTEIKVRGGELAAFDSLADRFLETTGEPAYSLFVEGPRWLATGDSARLREVAREAAGVDDDPLVGGILNAPVFTQNLDGAKILLAELVDPRRAPFVRALGHLALAHLEVAGGRWRAAQPHFAAADALRPGSGLEHRAYLATSPWLPLPEAELADVAADVAGWDARVPASGPFTGELFLPIFLETHVGSRGPIKLYLQGLLAARLGDREAVRSRAASLDTATLPLRAGSFASDAARTLRAIVWEMEGDAARALSELETAEMRVTYPLMFASAFHSRARHRYLRAGLLARTGRPERALDWYATIADQAVYDLVYLAPAALEQAEIHETLGDPERAAEHYRRFVELWRDADPELQPLVGDVEGRIERIESAGG